MMYGKQIEHNTKWEHRNKTRVALSKKSIEGDCGIWTRIAIKQKHISTECVVVAHPSPPLITPVLCVGSTLGALRLTVDPCILHSIHSVANSILYIRLRVWIKSENTHKTHPFDAHVPRPINYYSAARQLPSGRSQTAAPGIVCWCICIWISLVFVLVLFCLAKWMQSRCPLRRRLYVVEFSGSLWID